MATSVARPFIALSGEEIKKAIVNEIQRQLDADYRFKQHLTYPMVSWRWEMAINLYPTDAPAPHIVLEKTITAPGAPIPFAGAGQMVKLSSEQVVAAPLAGVTADSVRRDAGIPVPSPRTVRGPGNSKVTVDAPELPVPGQTAAAPETREGGAARVITQSKEVARSATVRTRAHPTGVMPSPVAGSAPDAEREAQIVKIEEGKPPEGDDSAA